jgi:hypothetical protein
MAELGPTDRISAPTRRAWERDGPGAGHNARATARHTRESYVPKASRRCLSAWRLRRESHSRTPYPSAKPTIRTIAVSSIESPPIRELEVTIKSHQTYMNLRRLLQTNVCYRSLSSVVKRAHATGAAAPIRTCRRVALRISRTVFSALSGMASGAVASVALAAAWGNSFNSFDHLVGAGEQRARHFESKRPSGVEVDEQFNLRGLLDREVRRLGTR